MHTLGTSFIMSCMAEEREERIRTKCPGSLVIGYNPIVEHHVLDLVKLPWFSWVLDFHWSVSWAWCSNFMHIWRWRQQCLPLHILDTARHHRDEWTEVNYFLLLFVLLVRVGEWALLVVFMLSQGLFCLPSLVSYVCQSPSFCFFWFLMFTRALLQ